MQPKVIALVTAFATAVPLAGWLTGNVGTECAPGGPCLLPVGFGLDAPSGAFVLGASFVLLDAVHEVGGSRAGHLDLPRFPALTGRCEPTAALGGDI
ncbi:MULTISPECIES: hypothetical protein [Shinella]|uniref:hypothetical protein n=1 Tax=Shinella TaxID=323620 RepID=UPI001F3D7C1B|nr:MULTISPECIES: hypothetical protein [Shinella]